MTSGRGGTTPRHITWSGATPARAISPLAVPPLAVPPSLLQRARRITRAVPETVVCCQTAAHVWGLKALTTPEAEWPVELLAPGHLAIPGCVTHLTPGAAGG